jgi:hypothetical protein
VSAAVEAFWSQNKIIIESPLASTTGSALRQRFRAAVNHGGGGSSSSSQHKNKPSSLSVNSPLSYDMKPNFNNINSNYSNRIQSFSTSGSTSSVYQSGCGRQQQQQHQQHSGNKRDQSSQTLLSLPISFDLSKISALKPYFNENYCDEHESDSPKKDPQLNNSIRKKLFDHNSDDLSSTTTTSTQYESVVSPKNKKSVETQLTLSKSHKKQHTAATPSKLPKPDIVSSASEANDVNRIKNLASTSSSNDDVFRDSFDYDVSSFFFCYF